MKLSAVAATCVALSAVILTTLVPASMSHAKPSGIFAKLDGVWRGTGRIKLSSGKSERIACRAYYNAKEAGGKLGLAIRCASAGNKIELRAQLDDQNGRLRGTWEERTFNATGDVTGTARTGNVRLSIKGAVSGSVNISFSNRRQSVAISTSTQGFSGIAISLRR